ncbi:MAG: chromate transporter [Leptothrix sp. (in: Bacteria)]|nr:chromate transporter [Leptothrix sp. (in: b-proteobacteria)]
MYLAFNRLALQGFGGVIPLAQRELVERERWLTREQFLELLSISQVLPGPNIVNMALIYGDRCFGWRGALAASSGVLAAPMVLVLVLAIVVRQAQHLPAVDHALRGMGVAAAGLVLSTAWKLAGGLRRNALGLPLATAFGALTLLAVAVLRWPLAVVVLGLGTLSVALAWRRIK